jgi:radical SAM protein with 4Fe4S-binding SPASM domain
MIDPSKFCTAPYRTAVISHDGQLLPCCEYLPEDNGNGKHYFNDVENWWNNGLATLRNKFKNGETDSNCRYCVSKESTPGIKTARWATNQQYYESVAKEYPTIQIPKTPDNIEIRFGNYCNLKCIMCGPYASSALATEYITNREIFNKHKIWWDNQVKTIRWWEEPGALDRLNKIVTNANTIMFTGGEPMMVPEIVDVLRNTRKTCKINFVTNLTKLSDKLFNEIIKFDSVNMTVSLEGIEDHNDYLRYESNWSVIDNNINRLLTAKNVEININHVLQHTSIFSLPKLVNYCQTKNIHLVLSTIYPPDSGLELCSAAPNDVEIFKKYLKLAPNPPLEQWINTYQFDANKHQKFYEYIDMLDSIRGNNFDRVFSPTRL